MERGVDYYVEAFSRLRANRRGGHTSPHKPVMLLAVLSLADNGRLPVNRIDYGPELLELFREYFDIVRTDRDQCTPLLPFFHLRSDAFWHHQPLPGQQAVYNALSDPGGAGKLAAIVAYAYLDDDLFALVATPSGRELLRDTLIRRYFPKHRAALLALSRREGDIGEYRDLLEQRAENKKGRQRSDDSYDEDVRDAGFRRTVTAAYDYRCAACGFRVIMEDLVLVDAAHLIPFNESQDNDPRNGMALCKNHHWAMDRHLIAPFTDNRWHVSKRLQRRIPDLVPLVELDGQPILLPAKEAYRPKPESLRWRMEHMKETA